MCVLIPVIRKAITSWMFGISSPVRNSGAKVVMGADQCPWGERDVGTTVISLYVCEILVWASAT